MDDLESVATNHARSLIDRLGTLHNELETITKDANLASHTDLKHNNRKTSTAVAQERANLAKRTSLKHVENDAKGKYHSRLMEIEFAINDDGAAAQKKGQETAEREYMIRERTLMLKQQAAELATAARKMNKSDLKVSVVTGDTSSGSLQSPRKAPPISSGVSGMSPSDNGYYFTDMVEVPVHLRPSVQLVVEKQLAKKEVALRETLRVEKQSEFTAMTQNIMNMKSLHKRQELFVQAAEFKHFKVKDEIRDIKDKVKPLLDMKQKMELVDVDALKHDLAFLEEEREYLYRALLGVGVGANMKDLTSPQRRVMQRVSTVTSNIDNGRGDLLKALTKEKAANRKMKAAVQKMAKMVAPGMKAQERLECISMNKYDDDAFVAEKKGTKAPKFKLKGVNAEGGMEGTQGSMSASMCQDQGTPFLGRENNWEEPGSPVSPRNFLRGRMMSKVNIKVSQVAGGVKRFSQALSSRRASTNDGGDRDDDDLRRSSVNFEAMADLPMTDQKAMDKIPHMLMAGKKFPNESTEYAAKNFVLRSVEAYSRLETIRTDQAEAMLEVVENIADSSLQESVSDIVGTAKLKSKAAKTTFLKSLYEEVDVLIDSLASLGPPVAIKKLNDTIAAAAAPKVLTAFQAVTAQVVAALPRADTPAETQVKEQRQTLYDLIKYTKDKMMDLEAGCVHLHHTVFLFCAKLRTDLDIPDTMMISGKDNAVARRKKHAKRMAQKKETFENLDLHTRTDIDAVVHKITGIMEQDLAQLRKHFEFATYGKKGNLSKMKAMVNEAMNDLREEVFSRSTMHELEAELPNIAARYQVMDEAKASMDVAKTLEAGTPSPKKTQRDIFVMTESSKLKLSDIIGEIKEKDMSYVLGQLCDTVLGAGNINILLQAVMRRIPPELDKLRRLPTPDEVLALVGAHPSEMPAYLSNFVTTTEVRGCVEMLKSEIKSRFPDYCASRCIGEGGCGSIVAIGGMCGPCHAKKVWQETLKVIKGNYAEAGTKPGAPPTPSWGALPLPGIAQQALRSLNDVLDKVANSPRGGGSNQRGGTPQSVALTMFIAPKSETATTGGEGGEQTPEAYEKIREAAAVLLQHRFRRLLLNIRRKVKIRDMDNMTDMQVKATLIAQLASIDGQIYAVSKQFEKARAVLGECCLAFHSASPEALGQMRGGGSSILGMKESEQEHLAEEVSLRWRTLRRASKMPKSTMVGRPEGFLDREKQKTGPMSRESEERVPTPSLVTQRVTTPQLSSLPKPETPSKMPHLKIAPSLHQVRLGLLDVSSPNHSSMARGVGHGMIASGKVTKVGEGALGHDDSFSPKANQMGAMVTQGANALPAWMAKLAAKAAGKAKAEQIIKEVKGNTNMFSDGGLGVLAAKNKAKREEEQLKDQARKQQIAQSPRSLAKKTAEADVLLKGGSSKKK